MSYYAHIEGDTVDAVIVIDTDTITEAGGWYLGGVFKPLNEWKETSMDTKDGVNEKGVPLRKNYAGIGYEYDSTLDAFIPPKTFDSWTLDTQKGKYVPPKEVPQDGKEYKWDNGKNDWVDNKGAAEIIG